MSNILRAPVVVAAAAVLLACSSPPPDPAADARPPWLSSARIFVDGPAHDAETDCRARVCRHNENTDLVRWNGALWLVHRTARSQILGPNSALLVYRSTDGGTSFTETARLPASDGRDLRDPHFFTVGAELHIKAIERLARTTPRDSDVDSTSIDLATTDGVIWSAPTLASALAGGGQSMWRIVEHEGARYSAAYADGDTAVALLRSAPGGKPPWTRIADVYTVAADTPLETELTFLPSGRLLALVRMDGTDAELLGTAGRLRTKVCWAMPPYASFTCDGELAGQRLDGPLTVARKGRLFVIARKHLGADGRKRTALFELGGTLDGGPLGIRERGELPSAGDTAYAGAVLLDDHRLLVSWYAGDLDKDAAWLFGMIDPTSIWLGVIDLAKL